MENFIITLVCIALLLMGAMSLSMSALNSMSAIANAQETSESLSRDILSTSIQCGNAVTTDSGATVTIDIENDGKKALANYSAWDVIVRYQDGDTVWIPYSTSTPGWTISGFFFQGGAEIYEPNILNPGETMRISVKLSPAVTDNSTNLAMVATPNGAVSEITFGW